MEQKIKHISHKLIDSLSDGVFSIALTLLGLDVVALVPKISESEDFNAELFHHWPTFLAYAVGFVVLFSWWYQYHVTGQYVVGTTAMTVWNHGLTMAWVALMPFGVALLAENLNTPNMEWGVFYFGVCLFGSAWTLIIQRIVVQIFKGDTSVTFTDDFVLAGFPHKEQQKFLIIFQAIPAVGGIVLVSLSFINPWLALAGYMLHILSLGNPVNSLSRMAPMMLRLSKS
jgi:uncharacterized membrane protein